MHPSLAQVQEAHNQEAAALLALKQGKKVDQKKLAALRSISEQLEVAYQERLRFN